ncbi:unnamed protein product [Pedinophyceae sp. YPF-701]|nr:unnamed protein product [Pedinophyceae sp. YPF-701]
MTGPSATLQLIHANGFENNLRRGIACHPTDPRKCLCALRHTLVEFTEGSSPPARFFRGHDDLITALAMSPDGVTAASGSMGTNSDVLVWDLPSGAIKFRLSEHDKLVTSLAFSHDGRLLVSAGEDGRIIVWDVSNGRIVGTANPHIRPTNNLVLSFSPCNHGASGREYRICGVAKNVFYMYYLDPYTGRVDLQKVNLKYINRDFKDCCFTADGAYAFAASNSGDVVVVNADNAELLGSVPQCSGGASCVDLHPATGEILVGGGDGTITQYVVNQPQPLVKYSINAPIVAMSFAADKRSLLCALANGTMASVDTQTWTHRVVMNAHCGPVTGVSCCHLDGAEEEVATGGADGCLHVWSVSSGRLLRSAETPASAGACLCVQLIGRDLVSGWMDGSLRCFDTGVLGKSGMVQKWSVANASSTGLSTLSVPASRQFVATGGQGGEVRVWDWATREMVAHMKQHSDVVTAIVCMSDNVHVVSASKDRSVMTWNALDEKRVSYNTSPSGGIFSIVKLSDTELLAVGADRRITHWDVRRPQPLDITEDAAKDNITSAALNPSATMLATGSADGEVRLWAVEPRARKLLASAQVHAGYVTGVTFSSDGRSLISVGVDGMCAFWAVNP